MTTKKTAPYVREWLFPLVTLGLALSVHVVSPLAGAKIAGHFSRSSVTLLSFLPPIFVLLGLFDAWIPREKVMAHMGHASGTRGILLALFLGSMAAGPLYLAFPIAAALRTKGAGVFNVMVFIGAWSTLKVPMFLFEFENLGGPFALTRYAVSFVTILAIAKCLTWINDRSDTNVIS